MSLTRRARAVAIRRVCLAVTAALIATIAPATAASAFEVAPGLTEAAPAAALASQDDVGPIHNLGVSRYGSFYGVEAAMTVVDPAIEHPQWGSGAQLRQKIRVSSCGYSRYFEVGWTESSTYDRLGGTGQYLYTDGSYQNGDQYKKTAWAHQPGDVVYARLRSLGNGIWEASVHSARVGGYLTLATLDLGSDHACFVWQGVEIRTDGRDFMFPPIKFGDGTTNGVWLQHQMGGAYQTWGPEPVQEYNTSGNGGYTTEYRSKYYDWSVKSKNAGPVARLYVSPSEGDLTTEFEASLEQSRDPNGDAITHEINWGDGTSSSGPRARHKYSSPGTYEVTGTVTEVSTGRTGQATRTVTVCGAYAEGECVTSPRPPASPDLCADAGVCDEPPQLPNKPVSLAPANDVVRTLPRTPKAEVMVVNANVLQAYARPSNPRHNENCNSNAKTCRSAEREAAFAYRIKALVRKALGTVDGMGMSPDVVLLQEAIREDAAGIASKLEEVTGYRYRVAAADASPVVAQEDSDDNGTMDSVTKSDSSIIYNRDTMIKKNTTSVVSTYDRATEGCPGGPQIDEDFDGIDDCEIAKMKKHFMTEFVERKFGTSTALRGGQRVAVATVHYVTASHLNSAATHERKTDQWSQEVATALESDFPAADSYLIGGDFNIERCADNTKPVGIYELATCAERTWWRTLKSLGFKDTVYAKHGSSNATLTAQYRDGCSSFDSDGKCVQKYRPKRIDFIFSEGQTTIMGASHDLTCGIVTNLPNGIAPNCDDLQNPQRYADHRLLWTLIKD